MFASFNAFRLFDNTDGWSGDSGSINRSAGGVRFRNATGCNGGDVGNERDLAIAWNPNAMHTLQLELASFAPGSIVKRLAPGGDSSQFWAIASYTIRFRD